MKTERLIGILAILLQKDKVTAPELADLFEVSRRTIQRDIESLSIAGIPIMTTQGVNGGIKIMDGYKIDRALLTQSDMQSILAGLRGLDSVSHTQYYQQLMEKISASSSTLLPADNHILINLSNWQQDHMARQIELIHDAITTHHYLHFTYLSPSHESQRIIEPYYLIYQWSSWYVYGWCAQRKDNRLFKLNRMIDLKAGESFSPRPVLPPDLSTVKLFPEKCLVKAIVNSDFRFRIIEDFGVESLTKIDEESYLFEFYFSSHQHILSWILSFGEGIELLEPEEMHDTFRQFGDSLIKKYSKHDR